jgi:D-alanine--poly(phosphoribitol) ligase subunit 1
MTYRFSVGAAFSERAGAASARTALTYSDGDGVSYGELNAMANRMAAYFYERGLRRRDVLGIVHTKTAHCYAAMLAALKLGAAYVNLDDQNPAPRLEHILRTARPRMIFAETLPETFAGPAANADALAIEMSHADTGSGIASAPCSEPSSMGDVTGSDPAYLMYTSGSTGVPKGALMTHAGVLNFGRWIGSRFGVGADDVLTNVNPMYFDNSVFDFYGAMLNGASLAPVTRDVVGDASKLLAAVEGAGCTVWFSVPSLLIYLMTMKVLTPERLRKIRSFVFGGEGYPKPELRRLHAVFGSRSKLINVYGPTECTCMCSAWNVSPEDLDDENALVTLGPIGENFSMLVLDGNRPVALGEAGELCLLGPQVGLGYANDADRTMAAFTPNPLNESWHERMYRTGDLVRIDRDGRKIHFVGRKDNQIKHMGYRIELEEIEAALQHVEGVVQCAVLQKAGRRDMKTLVAFVAAGDDLTPQWLASQLERLLPPYMIPQQFDVRRSLPKNANGKIDRTALAAEKPAG